MRARGGFWPSGVSRFGARTRRCAFSTTRPLDPQVDDPRVLFEAVYAQVLSDRKTQPPSPGSVGLLMPKELIWLVGAPGSGKGTHSRSIMEQRGITADPVVMSDLLLSGGPPSAGAESGDRAADVVRDAVRAAMNDGRLVPDSHVFTLLLHELAHERYEAGAVIDGFPRNVMQANLVLELHNKMKELRERFGAARLTFFAPPICSLSIRPPVSASQVPCCRALGAGRCQCGTSAEARHRSSG